MSHTSEEHVDTEIDEMPEEHPKLERTKKTIKPKPLEVEPETEDESESESDNEEEAETKRLTELLRKDEERKTRQRENSAKARAKKKAELEKARGLVSGAPITKKAVPVAAPVSKKAAPAPSRDLYEDEVEAIEVIVGKFIKQLKEIHGSEEVIFSYTRTNSRLLIQVGADSE